MPQLTEAQVRHLEMLATLPDESIDFPDIPELTAEQLARMKPAGWKQIR